MICLISTLAAIVYSTASAAPVDFDFILRLNKTIPRFIENVARHEVDLIGLAKKRRAILVALPTAATPREFLTIRVDTLGGGSVATAEPDAAGLADLRERFRAIYRALGSPNANELRDRAVSNVKLSAQTVGKQTYAAWLATRLAPLTEVERSVAWTDQAFANERVPGAKAFQSGHARVLDAIRFALWADGVESPSDRLDRFAEGDLDALANPVEFRARFKRLRGELGATRRRDRPLMNYVNALRTELTRDLVRINVRVEQTVKDTLFLAEAHPDLALFRSFFGDDCSSTACPATPYSKFERVFVVLDAARSVRGYVSTTKINVAGAPALYVNTLNGKRIGATQTLMILAGLENAAPHFGTRRLVLPTAQRIAENINSAVIANILNDVGRGTPAVALVVNDPAERGIIERFATADYDSIDANAFGHVVNASQNITVRISVEPTSAYGSFDSAPIEPVDAHRAAIDLIVANREEIARVLWTAAGRDLAPLALLRRTLMNEDRLPLADYHRALETVLHKIGFDDAPGEIVRRPGITQFGDVVAADGLLESERARTFARVMALIEQQRHPEKNSTVKAWLNALPEARRDELLVALARRFERLKDGLNEVETHDSPSYFMRSFLPSLVSWPYFIARARWLHQLGASWRELDHVAFSLGMNDPNSSGRAAQVALAEVALTAASTVADYARVILEFNPGTHQRTVLLKTIGQTLRHLCDLKPSPSQVEKVSKSLGHPPIFAGLLRWISRGPFASTKDFVDSLPDAPASDDFPAKDFYAAVLTLRLPEFLSLSNGAEDVRALAQKFPALMESDLTVVDELFRASVGSLEDWARLMVGPTQVGRERLMKYLIRHLDAAVDLYRSADPPARARAATLLREDFPEWTALLEREIAFAVATRPEDYLVSLHQWPIDPERAKELYGNGFAYLLDERLHHFLSLGPTISEFRALIATTEEVLSHYRHGAILVGNAADLAELTAPLNLPSVNPLFELYETIDLLNKVVQRPGIHQTLRETDIDDVMIARDIFAYRASVPPLGSCGAALTTITRSVF